MQLFIIGLAIQMASYFFFTCLFLPFLYRVRAYSPDTWTQSRGYSTDGRPVVRYLWWDDWRALAGALFISSIGVIVRSQLTASQSMLFIIPLAVLLKIRSVYRVVEGS